MSAATSQPANSAETAGGWQDVSQPAETVQNSQGAAQAGDAAQSGEPVAQSESPISPEMAARFASLAAQAQTVVEGLEEQTQAARLEHQAVEAAQAVQQAVEAAEAF